MDFITFLEALGTLVTDSTDSLCFPGNGVRTPRTDPGFPTPGIVLMDGRAILADCSWSIFLWQDPAYEYVEQLTVPSFDYFFQVTPAELVLTGLYKEKAEPWLVHDSYRAISICGIAKLLGARRAKAREKSRASACEPARESSRSPSPGDSAV